jgi:hypothetical protein
MAAMNISFLQLKSAKLTVAVSILVMYFAPLFFLARLCPLWNCVGISPPVHVQKSFSVMILFPISVSVYTGLHQFSLDKQQSYTATLAYEREAKQQYDPIFSNATCLLEGKGFL